MSMNEQLLLFIDTHNLKPSRVQNKVTSYRTFLDYSCQNSELEIELLIIEKTQARSSHKMPSNTNLNIGDKFINFKAETTIGPIDFFEWLGESWGILFSHPADYTPVCTTELARVAQIVPELEKRNCKPIALSCDSVESHKGWITDIKSYGKVTEFPYPIIADEKRELAVKLNMLDKDELNREGIPLTCRAVFIIDHNKKLRLSILYPASTGRNFDEILRVLDSLQMTDRNKVATPADWKNGGECMVLPTIDDKDLCTLFPKGVTKIEMPSGKGYIRKTPQP